jgi:hypothetical protein
MKPTKLGRREGKERGNGSIMKDVNFQATLYTCMV